MNSILPAVATLGVGGVLGWSAAHALKTVGKMLGCLLGVVFILLQILAYYGIAEIHWDKAAQAAPATQIASEGFRVLWKVLTYNLPFTGGFGAGFWLGIKK